MEGLAQEMAQPQGQGMAPQASPQQGGPAQPTVEEIIQAIMQGVDPEEMIQMGVNPELIMQAIQIIEQQMAAQQSAEGGEAGLAAQSVMGM